MFGKTPSGKASKGTVSVVSDKGRLRLSFPREMFGGNRQYLSLGLADTPENRLIAEGKKLQANLDIRNGEFDFTLKKYKLQSHLTVIESIKPKSEVKLDELWERYVAFKKPSVSPNTVKHGYRQVASHINKLPTTSIDDAIKIRDFLVKEAGLSPETLFRIKTQINACCNWAVDSELIDSNPFVKLFKTIKKPRSERKADEDFEDIKPFAAEERDAIITAFENNTYCSRFASKDKLHSNYTAYVKFMFFTGCRPNEAIALQWKHIDIKESITTVLFEQVVIDGDDGLELRQGLKTQKRRRINVSNRVRELLESIHPQDAKPDDLVFPSPSSKGWINTGNFSQRVWKPLLAKMGMEYRKPYNMRHTFITLASQSGSNIKDLARVVGNTPEVIYKHYLGVTRDFQMPET
jgi:integrase